MLLWINLVFDELCWIIKTSVMLLWIIGILNLAYCSFVHCLCHLDKAGCLCYFVRQNLAYVVIFCSHVNLFVSLCKPLRNNKKRRYVWAGPVARIGLVL